jgi:competence protein ComEC
MSFRLTATAFSPAPPVWHYIRLCLRWCDRNILLPITLCFMLGTVAGRFQPPCLSFLSEAGALIAVLLLSSAALFLSLYRKKHKRTHNPTALLLNIPIVLTLPLFFLIGHLNILYHLKIPHAAGHIFTLLQEQSQVTLVGTLATMVEERVEESTSLDNEQQTEQQSVKSRFEVEVQDILLHDGRKIWQPTHGRIRLSMQGRADDLRPGMTLMILARAGPITNFETPGVFDYKDYLAAKNIYVGGWIKSRRHITVVRERVTTGVQGKLHDLLHKLRYLPEKVRQRVSLFLRQHLRPSVAGTYQALLVGSRAGVSQEIQEQFKASGTMHMLAISGLHMGLLGLMAGAIISWLLKRSEWLLLRTHVPTITLLGTLPILLGYSFIAGMNTPVLRALIMATVLLAAVILRRQHAMLHLVATAALLVLIINPLSLFTASFQLSFSAVTALALFFPKIIRSADSAKPFGSEKTAKTITKESRSIHFLYRFTLPAVLVSVTATIGTLPFMLLHFHRFSTVGPIMNLLVEPFLCFWALPWGLAAVPLIFIAPQVATALLKIGGLGITSGQYCTAVGSAIPYSSLWTITPSVSEIFVYGLLILLLRLSLHFKMKRARNIALAGAVLLLLHFTWGLWFPTEPNSSQVAFLDVGQGSSCYLHLPDGSRILVDGGGNRKSSLNVGEHVIGPYLWKQRIWRLDQAVISHPHSDHFNGMDFILARFKPEKLYINGDQREEGKYQQILDQAEKLGIDIIIPESGQEIVRKNNLELVITGMSGLSAERNPSMSVNDASLVVKFTHGRRAFLFPGDISEKREKILLTDGINVTADVLLAAHHGSITSNSESFLAAVKPSLIVVSAGKNGQKYYPAPANRALWEQQGIPVRITRDQGTVTCTTDGNRLRCIGHKGQVCLFNSDRLPPL